MATLRNLVGVVFLLIVYRKEGQWEKAPHYQWYGVGEDMVGSMLF
jgi:hypothetical protein